MLRKLSMVTVALIVFLVSFSPVYAFELEDRMGLEIHSNRHTRPEPAAEPVERILDTEGYVLRLENDQLQVWFREEVHGIRVRVKETGYIWGSIYDDRAPDLNARWSNTANAFCTIEYFDYLEAIRIANLADESVVTEYVWRQDGFDCAISIPEARISLMVAMHLNDDHISFEIKEDPVEVIEQVTVQRTTFAQTREFIEEQHNKIKSVYFMPFFGTVRESEITGYIFVPDGSGALIRFREATHYAAQFDRRVYGRDPGIDSTTDMVSLESSRPDDYVVPEPQILTPIYGITHGVDEHAFIARVEGGAQYASIETFVAAPRLAYNYASVRFDYRQRYTQPINKRGSGLLVSQEEMNDMRPKISFYFLSGEDANYAGMARLYRSILLEENILSERAAPHGDVPLRVDIMGSDVKRGFLWNSTAAFTTVRQATEIVEALVHNGINNLNMTFFGWQRGGVNGSRSRQTSFERRVGRASDFRGLRDLVNGIGRFQLALAPVRMNHSQISLFRQAATSLSRNYINFFRPGYGTRMMFDIHYLLNPWRVVDNIKHITGRLSEFDFTVDHLGFLLYADYTRNNEMTRTETMEMFTQFDFGSLVGPNDYKWDNLEVFYDIPMGSSQYLFQSDTVPFLQMVLAGSVEYFAPYINQGFNSRSSLLKTLEYGAYPSYILTGVESRFLKDTPQEELYTTFYEDWLPSMTETYAEVNEALSLVKGYEMVDHKAIDYGVAMTVYGNGARVFVNYSSMDYYIAEHDVLVPAEGFAVKQ